MTLEARAAIYSQKQGGGVVNIAGQIMIDVRARKFSEDYYKDKEIFIYIFSIRRWKILFSLSTGLKFLLYLLLIARKNNELIYGDKYFCK